MRMRYINLLYILTLLTNKARINPGKTQIQQVPQYCGTSEQSRRRGPREFCIDVT